MFNSVRARLKASLEAKIYEFLMRNTRYHSGRKPFGTEELRLLNEALVSENLFGVDGKMVPAFEREFAQAYGVPYAVASTSGTAAIHTALGVLELNPGDEVITAPITDLGTVIPILSLNAVPVFADIDASYNMDPKDAEAKITDRTRAIVVVHLFGNPCNMDAMLEIAKRHKIPLIEDCSQSHMTMYKGKYVGTIGDIGCFSFQQSKHMTTGDGGMTITSNKDHYERMKLYVDKGFMRKGWGTRAYGFHAPNYRMNELTAAVGRAQLKKVKSVVEKRHQMGSLLSQKLTGLPGLTTSPVTEGGIHSYWLYPLRIDGMDLEGFAKKMIARHFWCAAGYTGKPIYLCSESLTAKKTYGTSQFPFGSSFCSRNYDYTPGLCPRAEETLEHLLTMPWDEDWGLDRVENAAKTLKSTYEEMTSGRSIAVQDQGSTLTTPAVPIQDKTNKIRIGIIGCGQMGQWHYEAYRKLENVYLAAFADTDPVKANFLAKKVHTQAYTDVREMLTKEKLDGVSICTAPVSHHSIALAALESGLHVLCEKPLAISAAQAKEMVQVARTHNRSLLTAFKFRFMEEVLNAKDLLDKKSFGRIISFRLMFGGYISMAGTWFADPAVSGGGVLIDNGPHAFDLVRYLLGDIDDLQVRTFKGQDIPVEDTVQISCRTQDGAHGRIDLSWSIPVPATNYLEIFAEEGAIWLDFQGLSYKYKSWDAFKRIPNQTTVKDGFAKQIAHFVGTIEGKAPVMTNADDGVKTQELIELAYRSIKE